MTSVPLPSGTVTFLFTDIEGSTPLWEADPQAMKIALQRHHDILHAAIQRSGGQVFQIVGDAFCSAFSVSAQAVEAAVSAQRALDAEPWGRTGPLRVRMGIHAGPAETRGAEYLSNHTLNRVQRIMSAGHGGQILVSLAVAELARGQLSDPIRLKDLGELRLKGLSTPERLFQVIVPDLPGDFPPLKTEDKPQHNLPVYLTPFIGREREVARVKELLRDARLVTVTGSGGVGKTRLAMRVGEEMYSGCPDGVWLVELAQLGDPDLIPQTMASVFSVREDQDRNVLDAITDFLRARRLLLLLDNCEHLADACARSVNHFLQACPELHILASSREALGVEGERVYPLPSLPFPDPRLVPALEKLAEFESIQLFINRAQAALPGFELTPDNAESISRVTSRLDGIPLAIELAAARVKMLRVEQIAERLGDSFRLLTGGSRTALPRHQTLRALIDWSYGLLSESEQVLFCRLSVFSGGWTLEASEEVCSEEEGEKREEEIASHVHPFEVLDLLSNLVNKSLVLADREQGEETRYRVLETIRQYAREKLIESGEVEGLLSKHLAYFLGLAERAEPELWLANQKLWLDRLEREHNNLRAALEWASESKGEANLRSGLKLALALEEFWLVRGYWSEGYSWVTRLLANENIDNRSPIYARVLRLAGKLDLKVGEGDAARLYYEKSLEISRSHQDRRAIAEGLDALGALAFGENQLQEAQVLSEQSLSLFQEIKYQPGVARLLSRLGNIARMEGDMPSARAYLRDNLRVCREMGHQLGIAGTLLLIGELDWQEGNLVQARASYERSLAIYREAGDKSGIAWACSHLGDVFRRLDSFDKAASCYTETLSIFQDLHDKYGIAFSLADLGFTALNRGDLAEANLIFKESLVTFRTMNDQEGMALSLAGLAGSESDPERAIRLFALAKPFLVSFVHQLSYGADFDRILNTIRGQLDAADFEAAWTEGQAMAAGGLHEVVEKVLEET